MIDSARKYNKMKKEKRNEIYMLPKQKNPYKTFTKILPYQEESEIY